MKCLMYQVGYIIRDDVNFIAYHLCLLNVGIQQFIRIFISDTEDLTDTEGTLDDESNSIFRYAFFIGVIILS